MQIFGVNFKYTSFDLRTVQCDYLIADKCYKKVYTEMTWNDALDHCHQEGGYLIAPETTEANDYVLSFLDGTAQGKFLICSSHTENLVFSHAILSSLRHLWCVLR